MTQKPSQQENFAKPNIVVSKCIEFDHCRYNGAMIRNDLVKKLKKHVNFIAVCPEVEIGLGVPRSPVRLVFTNYTLNLHQPSTSKDCTKDMNDFSENFLSGLSDIDGFLLKYKSPSCGPSNVRVYYEGKGSNEPPDQRTPKHGLFALKVMEKYHDYPLEDEARLLNYKIRETYLTKIFTMAKFREIERSGQTSALMNFHAANKFLFMAYNQNSMRKMGKIAANHEKKSIEEVMGLYKNNMQHCLKSPLKRPSMINVLQHMFGFFSNTLSGNEKQFFIDSLEMYRDERVPLSSVIMIIKTWALRDKVDYLLQQTILKPFPDELLELSDSGKMLDL